MKKSKPQKNLKYKLIDSAKAINKHFSDLSISISGELAFTNPILIQRQYYKSDLETF